MRTHRKYTSVEFARNGDRVREFAVLPNLSAARIEPVLDAVSGGLYLDVVFQKGDAFAIIPFIEIVPAMLDRRESSPFVWPAGVARYIDPSAADAIETALLPWIESEAFNTCLNSERIRHFAGEEERSLFDRARSAGFLGASPYAVVFRAAAPYVYASRYAAAKRVSINDACGASGAAMLSSTAAALAATAGSDAENVFANRWFDTELFGTTMVDPDISIGGTARAPAHIDLSAATGDRISVASPVPLDVTVSFDLDDAPECAAFGITPPVEEVKAVELPHFRANGGSAGRILVLVRDDSAQAPDADTDAANLLAARLRAEGFTVDVRSASGADPAGYDLVHCCCSAHAEQALPVLRKAHAAGIPAVLTDGGGTRDAEASWGTALVPQILRIARDETILEDHLRLMSARKLQAPGAMPDQEPVPGYRDAMRDLRGLVQAVVPADAPAFLPEPAPAGALPASSGYVLLHAPLHPRSNQFALVRASHDVRVPVVLAGPVADAEYARYLKAYAPAWVIFVPEPATNGALLGLYSGAAIYVDLAWTRLGSSRVALAKAAGCTILEPPKVDPADPASVAAALRDALPARRGRAVLPSGDPLTAVVAAYSNCVPAGRNT